MNVCRICNIELDTHPLASDCGGDCLLCMAESGDPDCVDAALEFARKIRDAELDWAEERKKA